MRVTRTAQTSRHGTVPSMLYVSTRGEAPPLGFSDALLAGLARDGGLYLPTEWPRIAPATIAGFAGRPFAEVAATVMAPFTGDDLPRPDLDTLLAATYRGFRHKAVAPLVQIDDNLFILELFHGPTLAFKDLAMQWLGRVMDNELRRRGRRATIIGATSGDTGAAAIEAFADLPQVDVFILYPKGRVSDVQRRQMTTCQAANVHALAVEGTFDDCQSIIKGLFGHHEFADKHGLAGVNSINWARIMAQVSYYFTSAVALGAPHRPVSFSVPTGNFGDVLAGYIAKRMGLPIARLLVATNANDILARTLATGHHDVRGVVATQSPSMDIQISSNFERLLFEANGRDSAALRGQMAALAQGGAFSLTTGQLAAIRADFDGGSADEAATTAEIARTWRASGYVLDPHTAVAVKVAREGLSRDPATPMVVLATAHPAKFPDAVKAACGQDAALPGFMADMATRPERTQVLVADLAVVERFIATHVRS